MNQMLKVLTDDLLPVYENEEGIKLVDAKEMHGAMLIGKKFDSWIKSRLITFKKDSDYFITPNYMLTMQTAKEIAIAQNTEMGRAIRKYFEEAEERFKPTRKAVSKVAPNYLKVIETVNEFARYTRMNHNEIYNWVYKIMKTQHGIDVKSRLENERMNINAQHYKKTGKPYAETTLKRKVNGIEVMIGMGVLGTFYSVLVDLLGKAKGVIS